MLLTSNEELFTFCFLWCIYDVNYCQFEWLCYSHYFMLRRTINCRKKLCLLHICKKSRSYGKFMCGVIQRYIQISTKMRMTALIKYRRRRVVSVTTKYFQKVNSHPQLKKRKKILLRYQKRWTFGHNTANKKLMKTFSWTTGFPTLLLIANF